MTLEFFRNIPNIYIQRKKRKFLEDLPILQEDPGKIVTIAHGYAEIVKNVANCELKNGVAGYVFGTDRSKTLLYMSSFALLKEEARTSTSSMHRIQISDIEKVIKYNKYK